jgi:hypothetical protein
MRTSKRIRSGVSVATLFKASSPSSAVEPDSPPRSIRPEALARGAVVQSQNASANGRQGGVCKALEGRSGGSARNLRQSSIIGLFRCFPPADTTCPELFTVEGSQRRREDDGPRRPSRAFGR